MTRNSSGPTLADTPATRSRWRILSARRRGTSPAILSPSETGQRPQQPGDERLLQAVGELVEDGGLRVELGQHGLGVDLRFSHGVGHEHGADGGDGEAQGEQHRVHQMSILTMRMIIPIPMATETAGTDEGEEPGAREHRVEVVRGSSS